MASRTAMAFLCISGSVALTNSEKIATPPCFRTFDVNIKSVHIFAKKRRPNSMVVLNSTNELSKHLKIKYVCRDYINIYQFMLFTSNSFILKDTKCDGLQSTHACEL